MQQDLSENGIQLQPDMLLSSFLNTHFSYKFNTKCNYCTMCILLYLLSIGGISLNIELKISLSYL